MSQKTVLLSLPGLRASDVMSMPSLNQLMADGEHALMTPSFPCVTCTVQSNMTTGRLARDHGMIANGLYDRESGDCEMWTAPNSSIQRPQIWETLAKRTASSERPLTSAVWFPMHTKNCEAQYACTPAPIHNPDGSESLWCYTKPTDLYGELRDALGHFPLMNYWGPMTNVKASQWIASSAVHAAKRWQPDFFYIYLPHLDYQAQRFGPDSPQAAEAIRELDELLGTLFQQIGDAYGESPTWLVASEYTITEVDSVTFPNRVLRNAGLLAVAQQNDETELLDLKSSRAWAMADHQLSHVFVKDSDPAVIADIAQMFTNMPGIAEVLSGDDLARYGLNHSRSGDVVLVSNRDSWQAYYWWDDDRRAPAFARTVDIHRKPGYDPVELFFDPATKSIPLDATLVRGSHGAPALDPDQKTVFLSSKTGLLDGVSEIADIEVYDIVLKSFGV